MRRHLSYTNIVGTLALFAAIAGGTAIAVSSKSGGGGGTIKLVTKQVEVTAHNDDPDVARADAKGVTLFKKGPITIYGKCYRDDDNDQIYANGFAKTKKNGVLMTAYEGDDLAGNDFLNKNTPEGQRQLTEESDSAGPNTTESRDHDNMIIFVVPGEKKHYRFDLQPFSKNDSIPGGNGPFKSGDRCIFAGSQVK